MAVASYQKGTWKTDIDVEEVDCGKYQGLVLLFHEGGESSEQIRHRTVDTFDTTEGAIAEAKLLAHRILGDL